MLELAPPAPGALDRVSTTRANDLLACPYRLAFQLDRRFDVLRRPTPAALLGTVAHRVVEAASTGSVAPGATGEQAEDELASLFDRLVKEASARLDAAWAPARPPRPEDWPGYHLIRIRALRRASELRSGARPSRSGVRIEVDLRDPTTALVGRPDRVEHDGTTTRVVDVKSGLSQGQPTPEQRRQLLLYAYLLAATGHRWPTEMVIEELGGRRWMEPVERAEAEEAVQLVAAAHRRFEAARTAGTLAEEARPDAETCRRCPSRPVCRPYWEALALRWEHASVAGRVTASSPGRLDVAVERPRDAAGATWVISGVPAIAPVDQITLVGAQRSISARHLRWAWWTTTWPPARVYRPSSTDEVSHQ